MTNNFPVDERRYMCDAVLQSDLRTNDQSCVPAEQLLLCQVKQQSQKREPTKSRPQESLAGFPIWRSPSRHHDGLAIHPSHHRDTKNRGARVRRRCHLGWLPRLSDRQQLETPQQKTSGVDACHRLTISARRSRSNRHLAS